MDITKLSPELLSSLAGVILSLLFSYVPVLNVKFAELLPEVKRAIMLGLIIVVGASIGGLACGGFITTVPCTQEGWISILQAVITVAITNQTIYAVTPRLSAVKKASKAYKA